MWQKKKKRNHNINSKKKKNLPNCGQNQVIFINLCPHKKSCPIKSFVLSFKMSITILKNKLKSKF